MKCTIEEFITMIKSNYPTHYDNVMSYVYKNCCLDETVLIERFTENGIFVRDSNGKLVYLSVTIRGGEKWLEAARERRQRILSQVQNNIKKINDRKKRGIRDRKMSLTDEDKRQWWSFMESNYPQNYEMAKNYYSGKRVRSWNN